MNRVIVMIVAGSVCTLAYSGIWDGLKSVGKGVTTAVDGVVETVSEVATNANTSVEIVPTQSVRQEQTISSNRQKEPRVYQAQKISPRHLPRRVAQPADLRSAQVPTRPQFQETQREKRAPHNHAFEPPSSLRRTQPVSKSRLSGLPGNGSIMRGSDCVVSPSVPASSHSRFGGGDDSLSPSDKKRHEKYHAFLREWSELESKLEGRSSQFIGSKSRMRGPMIRIVLDDANVEEIPCESNQEMSLAMRFYGNAKLRCPRTDALLDQWIQDTRQAYAKAREKRDADKKRYEKYHAFLREWCELEIKATQFIGSERRMIRIDLDDADVEDIPRESDQEISLAIRLYGSDMLRCPKTDALLDQWIQDTRQAYAKEREEREVQIKSIEDRLAVVRKIKKSLSAEDDDVAADFRIISFVDGKNVGALHQQTIRLACNGLPDDIDSYLKDKQQLDNLKYQVDSINKIMGVVHKGISQLQQEDEAVRAMRQKWRLDNADTNRPSVGPVRLGASIYEAARILCNEDYEKVGERGSKRAYSFARLGQLTDVTLEFREMMMTQGVSLVRGVYSVPKSCSYDNFVMQCVQELGGSPKKKTTRRMIGFDKDDLRRRNRWAAWQLEYYEKRAKLLKAQNRQNGAILHEALVSETGKRYKAKEMIVVMTSLSCNGYETSILSDVGGMTVSRVLVEDTIAQKESTKENQEAPTDQVREPGKQ